MRTLEHDPHNLDYFEEPRQAQGARKPKPGKPRERGPFDYSKPIEHFYDCRYSSEWIGELNALLSLLSEVPFRKKIRRWMTEDIHLWVTRCVKKAVLENVLTQDEADLFLESMRKERTSAITRLEKSGRSSLMSWERSPRNFADLIDNRRDREVYWD